MTGVEVVRAIVVRAGVGRIAGIAEAVIVGVRAIVAVVDQAVAVRVRFAIVGNEVAVTVDRLYLDPIRNPVAVAVPIFIRPHVNRAVHHAIKTVQVNWQRFDNVAVTIEIERVRRKGVVVAGGERCYIYGNHIGTGQTGTEAGLGNDSASVKLYNSEMVDTMRVGGLNEGEGNIIADGAYAGVFVDRRGSQIEVAGNTIRDHVSAGIISGSDSLRIVGNLIHGNGGRGFRWRTTALTTGYTTTPFTATATPAFTAG